jgi:hypothetical protein
VLTIDENDNYRDNIHYEEEIFLSEAGLTIEQKKRFNSADEGNAYALFDRC